MQLFFATSGDGELVVFHEGRLNFAALQQRARRRGRGAIKAARTPSGHLVVFDLLEAPGGEGLFSHPCRHGRLPAMTKTTDAETRQQVLEDAEALLRAKYDGGRDWLDPVRVMHAVRAAADRYGLDDAEQAEVPADDILAALTQLDEARAALDTLERDLTRVARRRGASWQQVADSPGDPAPAPRAASCAWRATPPATTATLPRPPAGRAGPRPRRGRLGAGQRAPAARRRAVPGLPGRLLAAAGPHPSPPGNSPPGTANSTDPPSPPGCAPCA
ncbi:hypothetical protein [Streptomyces sp. NPDC013455]|uniref:hypothetical protein n=1 Tax=Streptomyces sp. NPDC013455 TaxID=3155605 RepID=UPI0033D962FE